MSGPLVAGLMAGFGMFSASVESSGRIKALKAQEAALRQTAELQRSIGQFEVRLFNRQAKARRGAITALAGKSGVRTTEGSALEAVLTQAREDATGALQIKANREIQFYQLQNQADQTRFAHKLEKTNLPFKAIGRGLSMAAPFMGSA